MRVLKLWSVATIALLACDDPGSGTSGVIADGRVDSGSDATTSAPDTTSPDTAAPDTRDTFVPEPDTFVPDTTMPDTTVPDTTMPDTTMPDTTVPDTFVPDTTPPDTFVPDTAPPLDAVSPCSESCPPIDDGPNGVTITNNSSSSPPSLTGLSGEVEMAGVYVIKAITVYTKGAFDGVLVTGATVSDVGDTSGTANFVDGHWTFYLDLDLSLTAQTALGPQSGKSRNQITGGGCYTLSENEIISDTSACADGWPDGTTPPDTAEFAYDDTTGTFTLKIVADTDFILALVPPEYEVLATAAIKGPITFVARLEQ